MTQTKAALAISRARAALVLDQPFWATLALRLDPVEMGPPQCTTMATDGKHLYLNPAWVESITPAEVKFTICHEVCHVALLHHLRRGAREFGKWNRSCDFAVNQILVDAGYQMPKGGLLDPVYKGLSAEQIYARLPDPPKGGKGGPGQPGAGYGPPPQPGEVWDMPGEDGGQASAAEIEAAKSDWQVAVLQATQAAKACGKVPGFARELARAIRAPEIDWRDALRRYMTAVVRADYSWRKPNVRHLATGDWLPSLFSEAMGEVLVARDTSGSVSSAEDAAFFAEMNGILDEAKPERLHVLSFHSRVYRVDEYTEADYPLRVDRGESGGTAFSPIWETAAERGIEPVCAVVLTDLECNDFGSQPENYPVLWVSTGRDFAPWGEVVKLRI